MVRSSKVSYQNNHNECGFNFHVDFVPYRPYRVLKKQPNVNMVLVQFHAIFLILGIFVREYWKYSKYWYKMKISKIHRRNWFYFQTICLIILCDFWFGLWMGGQRYRNTLYIFKMKGSSRLTLPVETAKDTHLPRTSLLK